MYIKLLYYYLIQQIKVEMSYRFNLLVGLMGQVVFTVISITFIGTFLKLGNSVNGWGFYDILFLIGLSDITFGLNSIFTFRTYFSLNSKYIIGGEMDQLLVQPIHPLLNMILHNLNVSDLIIALKGVVITGIAAVHIDVAWNFVFIVKLIILIVVGACVHAGILITIASTGFWMLRRSESAIAFLGISQLCQYPLSIYPESVQVLLSFLLPLPFAAFYPAQYLLGIDPGTKGFFLPFLTILIVAGLCLLTAWIVFNKGLQKYNSVGS
ncbi:MAG: ABC-2 family transporter protein [Candidatus Theseobacter exili]|nr:ABC-2 family transporter protein [Candidatus Theseobacter exili]